MVTHLNLGKNISQKCYCLETMSSWGPGFSIKKGHSTLSHYHHVGFDVYAKEYFKMVRSVIYTHRMREFLFVFDKVNVYSSYLSLFEQTLKKNNYVKYLPYYPSQGFSIADRKDIVEPTFYKQQPPDQLDFFGLFRSIFDLQDKIKSRIYDLYNEKELPFLEITYSICLLPDEQDFSKLIERAKQFSLPPSGLKTACIHCSSRDQYLKFREVCPSDWTVMSMWDAAPFPVVTEEQKLDSLYCYLGSLVSIQQSKYLIGSFQSPSFTFGYCIDPKFRVPENHAIVDGSKFSHF